MVGRAAWLPCCCRGGRRVSLLLPWCGASACCFAVVALNVLLLIKSGITDSERKGDDTHTRYIRDHHDTNNGAASHDQSSEATSEAYYLTGLGRKLLQQPLTNLKVYIYELPLNFNDELARCAGSSKWGLCLDLDEEGLGTQLLGGYDTGVALHNSHQFSLEMTFHRKLLQSSYVTYEPDEATLLYVPYYAGLACMCQRERLTIPIERMNEMIWSILLNEHPYMTQGKPHFMALGKIEQEMSQPNGCSFLQGNSTSHMKYALIEKTYYHRSRVYFRRMGKEEEVIVAPYPSFIHHTFASNNSQLSQWMGRHNRTILVLMIGSLKHSQLRMKLANQLHRAAPRGLYRSTGVTECSLKNNNKPQHLVDLLRKSVFCLQPPGDTPTRKSFYDALLAGCIPVIFLQGVTYPFEDFIDYSKFTVFIDQDDIVVRQQNIVDTLSSIPDVMVTQMQKTLVHVAPFFQYSTAHAHEDAFSMLLRTVLYRYNITLNR